MIGNDEEYHSIKTAYDASTCIVSHLYYILCATMHSIYSPTLKPKCRCHFITVALYLAPTNFHLVILSGTSLEVKWEPAPDADQNSLTYSVTAESVNVETKRVTTTPGDSSVTLSSLQELTVYNVSVQAVNSGGPSRSLTAAVRMVTVGQLGRTGVQYLLCLI